MMYHTLVVNCGHLSHDDIKDKAPRWMIDSLRPAVQSDRGAIAFSKAAILELEITRPVSGRAPFGSFTLSTEGEPVLEAVNCWDKRYAGPACQLLQTRVRDLSDRYPELKLSEVPSLPPGYWLGIVFLPGGVKGLPLVRALALGLCPSISAAMLTEADVEGASPPPGEPALLKPLSIV